MRRAKPRIHEAGYHDLLDDLRHPGCPVCLGANRAAWRYIDGLLWELVNDPGVRARLRESHGFCREHALLVLDIGLEQGNALGIAILYEDLLTHISQKAVCAPRGRRENLLQSRRRPDPTRLAPRGDCPACETGRHVAANYLRILATADAASEIGRAARQESRGLCVSHLVHGLRLAPSPEHADRLLDIYLRGESELRTDLREFIRKQNWWHQEEPFGQEVGAWKRAVYRVIGEPLRGSQPRRQAPEEHRE